MMRSTAIAYRSGELWACEQDDVWTVRLAQLETRARYLDLALAELLGNAPEAHRAAARLLAELAEVTERQEDSCSGVAPTPVRTRRRVPRQRGPAKPVVLGVRALVFALVASTAFMVTTWLTAVR